MNDVRKLTVVVIRPTKYDDDGYVIRYVRGVLPSNTIACMRSLTLEFADRWKHDHDIDITVEAYDEMVERVPIGRLAGKNRRGRKVVAALVGVQSNQFVRAGDLARQLTDAGIKTLIGGFHVSGVLQMFETPTPAIQELIDYGVTVVKGEAEDVWESILLDVVRGEEKMVYRAETFPDISERPVPQADERYMQKFAIPEMGTVDCSRGCPFNCSFCTIINVQGRKMRCRSGDSVIRTVRESYGRGIREYFFTDDNFSRNRNWEEIFDGFIHLREEEGLDVCFMMQVDTACDKIPGFVEKAGHAGCTQVFIGMESINPRNLEAAGKSQNKADHYAAFIDAWHTVGVMTHVGYIIGFPFDTLESVKGDIDTLKNDIKVDQASFFILTPLPGSRDHYELVQSGAYMDDDLNNYDSFHVTTKHPRMSGGEVMEAYEYAWRSFYEFDNLKKILMRAGREEYWGIFKNIMWYKNSLLEPRHPMVAGFIRLKNRKDIRPGTPVMGFWRYYTRRLMELAGGLRKRVDLFFELQELWLLTRRPDDPVFRKVADFTTTVGDTRRRFSSVGLKSSYAEWSGEMAETVAALRQKIADLCSENMLSKKRKKRLRALADDLGASMETFDFRDNYQRGMAMFNTYLQKQSARLEEFALKQVGRRRRITTFWKVTWERLRKGKMLSLSFSLPRIMVNAVRDIRMSIAFTYHLLNRHS